MSATSCSRAAALLFLSSASRPITGMRRPSNSKDCASDTASSNVIPSARSPRVPRDETTRDGDTSVRRGGLSGQRPALFRESLDKSHCLGAEDRLRILVRRGQTGLVESHPTAAGFGAFASFRVAHQCHFTTSAGSRVIPLAAQARRARRRRRPCCRAPASEPAARCHVSHRARRWSPTGRRPRWRRPASSPTDESRATRVSAE